MNLLNRLTIKNLKLNKKRTIVTIIGIILSVALLAAVASMFFSARASLIAYQIDTYGNFHYNFKEVSEEEVQALKINRNIEKIFLAENLGYAKLEGIKNDYKPYVFVKGFTKETFQALSVEVEEGRLPQNEKEIVIPAHLSMNGGVEIKVGETLKLDLGTRMCDGFEQTQDNPFDPASPEEIVDTKTYEYKVVGIISRLSLQAEPYSAPGYTMLTYSDGENIGKTADIYARYTKENLKNHLDTTAKILGIDPEVFELYHSDEFWMLSSAKMDEVQETVLNRKFEYSQNENLLMLETGMLKDPTLQVLAAAGMIVVLIIIFTSVYCIKNSFDISIAEKIRQYGMLSSIGATSKQIKRNVYNEAYILGAIGIPLGILSGLFASFILIRVTDYFLRDMLGFQMQFAFSWLTIVITVILGVITVILSARKSAHKASKISPIQAIRNSDDIKISATNVRTPKWVGNLFGIGGEISYKNLQRSKKKYRTTVISIVVCVMVFIVVSSFVEFAFETVKVQYHTWNYNMMITYHSDDGVEEKLEEIRNLEHVKQVSSQADASIRFQTDQYTKEYLDFCREIGMFDIPEGQEKVTIEDSTSIYVLDNASFKEYAEKLGLDFEEVKDKGILINRIFERQYIGDSGQAKEVELEKYAFEPGDKITGTISKYIYGSEDQEVREVSLEIAALTGEAPFGMDDHPNWTAFIVGEDLKTEILSDNYHGNIYINSSDAGTTQKELESLLGDDYGAISNFAEAADSEKSLFTLIAIFLYGFIIVIALIGVTNIFNTITTNMNLRRREFTMLKSVGMTGKEFNRMIQLESFFYGMKSLLIGIPAGCILSYLIYQVLTQGLVELAFQLPIKAIVIAIITVFLLITVIMKYSISKINKQNIIETIRNENI